MSTYPDTMDIVRRIPGFSELDDASLAMIAASATLSSVSEGAFFYKEDDDSYDIYFIVSGTVGILSRKPDTVDDSSELFTLRSGMLFGVLSFLDGARRDLSAIARERTLALVIDGPRLKEACVADPTVGRAVYALFGKVASRRARDVALELRNTMAERV